MASCRCLRWLLLGLGLLLLIPQAVRADVGPKPGMSFTFRYEIPVVEIIDGQLIECDDASCISGEPLEELGPQRFHCEDGKCSAIAYSFSSYHKLVIRFADRTRESNVFGKRAFNAAYTVTVTEDALQVTEKMGLNQCCFCFPASIVTLLAELGVAAAYLSFFQLPKALLGWVPIASLVTLPLVWLVFPQLPVPAGYVIAAAEVFAVAAEAGLLYFAARRRVSLRHVAALSLAMNAVSFAVGLVALPAL